MKKIVFPLLSSFALVMLISQAVMAAQVSPGNNDADLNGDGQVTETELKFFNRDERGN